MLRNVLIATLFLCLLGCKEESKDPLRLDHSVKPLSQLIALTLDPDKDTYYGSVDIKIELTNAMNEFRFHGRDLSILKVEIKADEMEKPLAFTEGEKGTITATAPSPLDPGIYSLRISFTNDFSRQGTGIYKVEYEGRNYLYTQMEPEYARDSFPCWDAPEFKIPWALQLMVPSNYTAYANTPVQKERAVAGMKEVVFEQSKPMPSYLLALAVGTFEEVSIDDFPVAGKLIVPMGKTGLASEAARISPPLLRALEAYFEIPYPYRKLDQIAVPEFNFGAMENAGLITYRDTAMLRDPKAMTLGQKQWLASIVAHEMSHMWFGNLVTPVWWNDLWLNESFASWIALKMVNRTFPEYEMKNKDIKSRQRAFGTDALSTSRPIRRPIAASDAMAHLFDSLAYNKGMAVLDMVENWMGEKQFRKGMIRYMNDHAWGNTDAFDLAASLGEVVDGEILDIMKSFVSQAGIPLLRMELIGDSKIRITQSRYAHYGVELADAPLWKIPVSLKYGLGDEIHTQKMLLHKRVQTFKLDHPAEWIYPNAEEKGYYRWHISAVPLPKLANKVSGQNVRNRMGLISNIEALFAAGLIDAGEYLETLSSFSWDESPEVRQAVVRNLDDFARGMIPPELETQYGEFLSSVFKPMLEKVGMEKQPDEDALIEQLRPALVGALGWRCKDADILKTAADHTLRYMEDPYSVDPSLAQPYLRLAAMNGDESLFAAFRIQYEAATIPIEKSNYLNGLSGFRDRDLMLKALAYTLSEQVPPHQFSTIPHNLADTDVNRRLVIDWLKENYPAVQIKIPEQSISYLPWMACGQSPELLADAKAFLLSDERKTQGMEIEFGKAEAVVQLNANLRSREQENISRFLKEQ